MGSRAASANEALGEQLTNRAGASKRRASARFGGLENLVELGQSLVEPGLRLGGQLALGDDLLGNLGIASIDEIEKLLRPSSHVAFRHVAQPAAPVRIISVGGSVNLDHLPLDRHWLV